MKTVVFAALLCGCGSSATFGAVAGVCEAHEAALETACAAPDTNNDGEGDGVCTGELSTEEYQRALGCARDLCDAIQARIESGVDDE